MDQEKFASLNQPSNANMPRDTVETLKQIQKQGLSISIVPGNSASFALPSTTSADNRQKQSVLTVDKPKILPRPQTTTDNKILQTRLTSSADTRVSSGRVTTQSSFHDSKAPSTQTRPPQPPVSEGKGFNQVWSGPSTSTESKSQGPIPTTPANKIQTNQSRLSQIHMPDNKTPVSRSNQSMIAENKNQGRITQGQRVTQNQQLIEGKMLSNDRVNPTSPPDAKVFSNQVRTGQQFVASQDNKPNPMQRVVTQKATDVKIANQLNNNKQIDVKASQVNRVVQNVKVLPESNQGKGRQNYTVKTDGKSSISGNSPMILENKTQTLRLVNVVESGATRTTQCKSQMRLGTEAPTAVQTKMICTAVTTKMICYQSVPAQPDKNMILQGAKVTASSSDMIQKTAASFDIPAETSHGNPMCNRIAASKRSTTILGTPAKKKCFKRIIPSSAEISAKSQDANNMTSPEDGNENEDQFFNNLKTSRTGLTITPVRAATSSVPVSAPNSVGVVRMPGDLIDKDMFSRLTWENSAMVATQRGKPRSRGRRKYVEPVCLTLSSDDEEEHMQAPFNSIEEAMNVQMFPQESEGSKSGQSSPVYQDEENPESDDPQFPGVTDIHPKAGEGRVHYEDEEEEEDEEKDMDDMEMDEEESIGEEEEEEMEESEMEEEEEEEVPPEDDEDDPMLTKAPLENITSLKQPLQCRSIRIGSFKIHPKTVNSVLRVYLAMDGISFNAPMVSDATKIVNITLKPCDVTQLFVHFGKCLPILFIFTTPSFGENVRKSLNMTGPECSFFDPSSTDERVKKITFLIDTVNEEQRRFLRYTFLNDKKVRELDQKTANEILVKSTPSQNQIVRCEIAQPFQMSQENVISVTAIQPTLQMLKAAQAQAAPPPPPQPVTKLFTYPPPPQTGGITITTEDVACLNEGEFLNDAIIDFYLKYVFYEKLSDYHREKTHIFSSYFYPRLTHKPERPRPGEDVQKNVQLRRHSMVKTWTRHVDIFSKDFIIIPVNQNVHWFLAIICYPGLVPEAAEIPPKPDSKTNNKSSDNVTSTDDQEENKTAKEPNSTVDGSNQNSDENSTASSNSMFEPEEPDSEEPMPEAPDSSTHPDKNRRRKEAPCICIFDSLNGPNRSRIATMLREYLEIEWKMKKGTRKVFDKNTMQGFIMQCPQQNNYSDCGVYVLQYVESFFENPIPYFDSPIPNLTNWFTKEKVSKKRQELKDLIASLQNKYSVITVRKPISSENVPSSPAQTVQADNR